MRYDYAALTAALLLSAPLARCSETVFRDGFEDGLKPWRIAYGKEMVSLSPTAAAGRQSLQLTDTSEKDGTAVESPFLPAKKGIYRLTGKLMILDGYGPGINVEFFDRDHKKIDQANLYFGSKPSTTGVWTDFKLEAPACHDETAYLKIRLASWQKVTNTLRFDEIVLTRDDAHPIPPPWKAQYKIKPEEKSRLTAADVVGPDGIVYPNWSRAGVQGGIPDLSRLPVADLKKFGGLPDDKQDDSAAVLKACASLPKGGIIQLENGEYNFSRLIRITADNIIIRGRGMDRTKIRCDYAIPADGIDFYGLTPGQKIGPATAIHTYCRPEKLISIKVTLNGTVIGSWQRSMHSGNSFALVTDCTAASGLAAGPATIKAEAVYEGRIITKSIPVNFDPAEKYSGLIAKPAAALQFAGTGLVGDEILLTEDGRRGSNVLSLSRADHGLKAGDMVRVFAPETPRRRKEVRNACNWGVYRNYLVYVKAVNGTKIILDQPLRIDFPVIDGSSVKKAEMINKCGIADLTLEATENLWLSTVEFRFAVNCWAKGVKVIKTGRNPIYGNEAKFCTIRDCQFDDAWFKGGGGTAYVGWEHSYDNLMENVTTWKMRHAPLFQWSASGNVIRNGTFYDSDAQWHSGWTNENLFENCVVKSLTTANGGYGFGMWASPPEDGAHGPNGPRNVIYNCDVTSLKDGLWLGGMNENWLVLYNRFRVKKGPGVFLKTFGFDHIIKGNVFVLEDKKSPAVRFSSPDCTGVELLDNRLYGGNGKLFLGLIAPAVDRGNQVLPFKADAPRPQPAVPSIYEWQLRHVKQP